MAIDTLKLLGFSPHHSFAIRNWKIVPDTPGVYVIFDGEEAIYVGMAGRNGRGSLRRRLRDHSSGQLVNMFIQYLLFDRILYTVDTPRSPREAKCHCRAYIRQKCEFRFLVVPDRMEARKIENQLQRELRPTFNQTA